MKRLTPHQIAVLGIDVDALVKDAYYGFDLDTIQPAPGGGYRIGVASPRIPAPRGPPHEEPENDIWTLGALARRAAHNTQVRPPMTSSFALDDPPRPRKRREAIPLRDRRAPRLTSDENIGRLAVQAGRIIDPIPVKGKPRSEALRLLGRIWCAGEELTPSEVRAVLADASKVRKLVRHLYLKPKERMELYGHLNTLIDDLTNRLQLRLFD